MATQTLTIKKIGEVTEKGNVTLSLALKTGIKKDFRTIYMLAEAEDIADLTVGQDIASMVGKIEVKESAWTTEDGEERVSYWLI